MMEGKSASEMEEITEVEDVYKKMKTAAQWGNLTEMIVLVNDKKVDPSLGDETGATPLHWAALNNRVSVMHFLLKDCGVSVDPENEHGVTPLHWACLTGNIEAAALLTNNQAAVDRKDKMGYTPLVHAGQYGKTKLCHYLLLLGADVDACDNFGHTALHWAAYGGHVDCCRYLINRGADIARQDDRLMTPLHWAIITNRDMAVALLLEMDKSGRTIEMKEDRGMTPMDLAQEQTTPGGGSQCKDQCGKECGSSGGGMAIMSMTARRIQSHEQKLKQQSSSFHHLKQKVVWHLPIFFIPLFFFGFLPRMAAWMALGVMLAMFVGVGHFLRVSDIRLDEKNPFAMYFYLSMAFTSTYMYVESIVPATPTYVFSHIFILTLFVATMFFYYKSSTTDPGIVRRDKRDDEAILEMGRQGTLMDSSFELCSTCIVRKPLRSKHCRVCNHCVGRFDHHCPWMNCCLGFKNHPYFMGWATCEAFLHILFMYLCMATLNTIPGVPTLQFGAAGPWIAYCFAKERGLACMMAFHSLVTLMAWGLVYTHVRMMLSNITSNELVGGGRYSYSVKPHAQGLEYPSTLFNRGWGDNFSDFCSLRVDWRKIFSVNDPTLKLTPQMKLIADTRGRTSSA